MVMSAFAPHLKHVGSTVECGGHLNVHRWRFAPGDDDLHALAVEVGRQYVSEAARLATPGASLANKVPARDSVVAGDFGEMLARAVYTRRVGLEAPFSKLQGMKPVADATVQGPDVMCLTLAPGDDPLPVTVEAKTRAGGGPAAVLGAIGKSTNLDEDYLASAWAAAAELMLSHPDHRRHFALSAAQHLGRLVDPGAALPPQILPPLLHKPKMRTKSPRFRGLFVHFDAFRYGFIPRFLPRRAPAAPACPRVPDRANGRLDAGSGCRRVGGWGAPVHGAAVCCRTIE